MTDRRIYVACLASYNAGILYGAWIDVSDDASEMQDAINSMLAKSPTSGAEEWRIDDQDGDWMGIKVDGYDLDKIAMHEEMLNDHGGAWAAYVDTVGDHYATPSGFEDACVCAYPDPETWAEEILEGTFDLPENLRFYFDYAKYARDCQLSGDVTFVDDPDGGIYVVNNH